jgi:uncharacterized RDD family membrane protein YckC
MTQPPRGGGAPLPLSEEELTHPFAGIVTRSVAIAIDGGAAAALFAVAAIGVSGALAALGLADVGTAASLLGTSAVWLVFVVGYFVICWSTTGQTIGMRMMGLRLVTRENHPPNLCRSVVRYFAQFLSILLLFSGVIMIMIQSQRRALHDLIAGTFVIYVDVPQAAVEAALQERPGGTDQPSALAPATDQTAT